MAIGNITIEPKAQLNILIKAADLINKPRATIISHEGNAIVELELVSGVNIIDITPYLYKECAVRVVNGKNVTVQKI
jgi:hypothetical protein